MLLTEISPTAAKIYLVLSTLAKPNADPPIAQVPLKTLSRLANLAPRTCSLALRQLLDLRMLTRLPRRDAAPTAYILAPLHYTHLDAPPPTNHAHPHAPSAPNAPPDARPSPTYAHPHAPSPAATPLPNPKTHKAHQDAPNTTQPAEDLLLDPATIQLFGSLLTPSQKTELLALAQATLARLDKEPSA